MTIPALPTAPSPSDDTPTFNARAFAFVSALSPWAAAANALATAMDATAAAASASATAAAGSASAASTSATSAAASAVDSATATGAPLWVSGTSYSAGAAAVSPANLQVYRRVIAGAGATDPSLDATNWRRAVPSGPSAESLYFY